MPEAVWYYSHAGIQRGPVSIDELRRLVASAGLSGADVVWKQGMAGWSPIRSVEGLVEHGPPPALPPPLVGAVPERVERGRSFLHNLVGRAEGLSESSAAAARSFGHVRLTARILDHLRGFLNSAVLSKVDRLAHHVGHLAYMLTALLLLTFYVLLAIKADVVSVLFLGLVVIVPLFLVGHYAATTFLDSGSKLLSGLPGRIFSRALLDLVGLMAIMAAVGFFLVGLFRLIQGESFLVFGVGCVASPLCLYLAGLALNPASLGIEVVEGEDDGEEALGIFTFGLKLIPRLTPVIFGLGSVAGAVAAIYFIAKLFQNEIFGIAYPVVFELSIFDLTLGFLALGFVPLAAHLVFMVLNMLLGILRSVLAAHERLDRPQGRLVG